MTNQNEQKSAHPDQKPQANQEQKSGQQSQTPGKPGQQGDQKPTENPAQQK
jgi:hypothetical protein